MNISNTQIDDDPTQVIVNRDKTGAITEINMRKGYDFHVHLRDEDQMESSVRFSAKDFLGGIIMPNLKPPVSSVALAQAYKARIDKACTYYEVQFKPLMTLYLTDETTPEEIQRAKESGIIYGCKLYPAGATTNSAAGVTDIEKIYCTLEKMEQLDMPLLIHGEVTDNTVDIFDREERFILDILYEKIIKRFPSLRIVCEHITTEVAANFVERCEENIVATITAHHLFCNRNAMLVGGIRPHYYCLPILKRETDRQALLRVATSGNEKFFLGTDSAPHAIKSKLSPCGCAGCFTAPIALSVYAEVFEKYCTAKDISDWPIRLEQFASINGSEFYRLPLSRERITLIKEPWIVPEYYDFGKRPLFVMENGFGQNNSEGNDYSDQSYQVAPFLAGEVMSWKVK